MSSGFLLINKPVDWTSHDVVGYLRKVIGIKTIGHSGTLDPFATGLLIVGIGREATRRLDQFKALPKTYVATLRLGAVSDTYDRTGKITPLLGKEGCLGEPSEPGGVVDAVENEVVREPTHGSTTPPACGLGAPPFQGGEILSVLKNFVGKQLQIPPMYSAKKIGGKKLYELARQGKEIERKPCEIEIFDIELLDVQDGCLKIRIKCSTGTYIRSLAHDIGQALGCGSYCEELVRTTIGDFSLDNAVGPAMLNQENIWKHIAHMDSPPH